MEVKIRKSIKLFICGSNHFSESGTLSNTFWRRWKGSCLPIKSWRTLISKKTYPPNLMSLMLPPFPIKFRPTSVSSHPSLKAKIGSRRDIHSDSGIGIPNRLFFTLQLLRWQLRRYSFSASNHLTLASNRATSIGPSRFSACRFFFSS